MAEFLRLIADRLQPLLEERQTELQGTFGQISYDAALEAHGDQEKLAQLLENPAQDIARVLEAKNAIDTLYIVAEKLEAAGFKNLPGEAYEELYNSLVIPQKEEEIDTSQLTSFKATAKELRTSHQAIMNRYVDQLQEGVDYIITGGGPLRTRRAFTPVGYNKLKNLLAQPQEQEIPTDEKMYIHNASAIGIFNVVEINPKTGRFKNNNLQNIANSLLEPKYRKPQKNKKLAYTRLGVEKARFNSMLRASSAEFETVTIKDTLDTFFEQKWDQHHNQGGEAPDQVWEEETCAYIIDNFGELTVDSFITGVTNRFSLKIEEGWTTLRETLDGLVKPKDLNKVPLAKLTPGVHCRQKGRQVLLSPEGQQLINTAILQITGTITPDKFDDALETAFLLQREREKVLQKISPDKLSWNGNRKIAELLDHSEIAEHLESDILPLLPSYQEGRFSSLVSLAESYQLIDTEQYNTINEWFGEMIGKHTQKKHKGQYHSIPFYSRIGDQFIPENEDVIGRFSRYTDDAQNWLEILDPEMYGYRLLIALMTELQTSPQALGEFKRVANLHYMNQKDNHG